MLGSVDEAEDAVQDAFIRAFEQLRQCRDPDNFAGWFFLILRNRCLAERRRVARAGPGPEAVVVPAAEQADGRLVREARRRPLQQAPLGLTPEHRGVFGLKLVEALSYEDIAGGPGASFPC